MSTHDQVPGATWRCPRCESDRAAGDDFCGRCGAGRPVPAAGDAGPDRTADRRGLPVFRALALNGTIVVAVILVILFARRDGGPTTIAFEPHLWRCDGSERTWIAAIPASAPDIRLDWLTGGPAGEVHATSTAERVALEPYRQVDGTFRITTTETVSPECGLADGTWTLTIRDAASNALIASGTVDLDRP